MKKRIGLLTACVFLFASTLQVNADVIWEPEHDTFYAEYASKCEYLNRKYITNGPDNQVIVYESPESTEQVTAWGNGKEVYLSFAYTDDAGVVWGIYDNGDEAESGWVRLDQMEVIYDYISFEEDHAEAIVEETGNLPIEGEQEVMFWKYPGAMESTTVTLGTDSVPQYSQTYVDEEGRKWGYIGYFRGMKNYWVCLDAMSASFDDLYPHFWDDAVTSTIERLEPEAESEQAATVEQSAESQAVNDTPATTTSSEQEAEGNVPFVVTIIAAVVVVTGGLLVGVKKSFQAKNKEN